MNNYDRYANKGHILVVDDEALNRTLLLANLQEAGYTVKTAQDGEQALEFLYAQSFDAVLLDLIMPRMDGFQVLATMKEDPVLRRIPVIVISSMDDMASMVRCIEMGATDYLAKPFNPILLHARIRASLASLNEERMALLREQFAQVTAAQEEERQRIARELHDGLGPTLAGLNIRLLTIHRQLEREDHPLAAEVKQMAEHAQVSIRDIRRLIHDLRPVALDELGLVPALREYLSRCQHEHGLSIEFAADNGERLPAALETALFRITQEAVNNVVRHAQAGLVQVALNRREDHINLSIVDDGQGFEVHPPCSGKHLGLWSMCERVEQLGGQFQVQSAPGQGTTVTTSVPL
jgi:signal transduction histidine kinase